MAASTAASTTLAPARQPLLGELDDQDGVLGAEAHGRDQADLQIDVVLEAGELGHDHRADDPQRDDQQHRERDGPAFVQRGEAQEHDQQRQAVEHRRLAARLLLFID